MGYCLINGKRYYRDDQTGRLTVDNVSQQEADRRMNRTENRSVSRGTAVRSGSMAASQNSRGTVRNAAPARRRSRRIPWGWILAAAVILSVIGAFVYNRSHISAEEQTISSYMQAVFGNGDSAEVSPENSDTSNVSAEEAAEKSGYLLPESDVRYLDASEVENYSHDEIQLRINEIYARHGRVFQSRTNAEYFGAQSWYQPVEGKSDEQIVSEFNEYEKANVELLSAYL